LNYYGNSFLLFTSWNSSSLESRDWERSVGDVQESDKRDTFPLSFQSALYLFSSCTISFHLNFVPFFLPLGHHRFKDVQLSLKCRQESYSLYPISSSGILIIMNEVNGPLLLTNPGANDGRRYEGDDRWKGAGWQVKSERIWGYKIECLPSIPFRPYNMWMNEGIERMGERSEW